MLKNSPQVFCLCHRIVNYWQHIKQHPFNEGISAASFWHQVAALVPDMFYNFYLVKNHKIVNSSLTTDAREKITTYLESLEFCNFLKICLTNFKNYHI